MAQTFSDIVLKNSDNVRKNKHRIEQDYIKPFLVFVQSHMVTNWPRPI